MIRVLVGLLGAATILGTLVHVNGASAGPQNCDCLTYTRWTAAGVISGVATCGGCPNPDCSEVTGDSVLVGPQGDEDTCIVAHSWRPGQSSENVYESPQEACGNNNMFLYEWDISGGLNVPQCHFGGDFTAPRYQFGLPWCHSAVDFGGAITGVPAWIGSSTLALWYHGAPGWRGETNDSVAAQAIDIFGRSCFVGDPDADVLPGDKVGYQHEQLVDMGLAPPGGTSVQAGFCAVNGFFSPIAVHRCKVSTRIE